MPKKVSKYASNNNRRSGSYSPPSTPSSVRPPKPVSSFQTQSPCPKCGSYKYCTCVSFMKRIDMIREQEKYQKEYGGIYQSVVNDLKALDKQREENDAKLARLLAEIENRRNGTLWTKLKCVLGFHAAENIESSESRNHKLREQGIPLRASMAGWNKYRCKRCQKEWTKVWTAF